MKQPKILKNKFVALSLVLVLLVAFVYFVFYSVGNILQTRNTMVKLETTKGDIVIELYPETPRTSKNFKSLVEKGFYDKVIFHRVIKDFMIQSGDPTGTGRGGPGYVIEDEFVDGLSNVRGTISMANSGPNTGGSQFFINVVDNEYLDFDKQPMTSKHVVFGEVVEGMDVVDEISKVEVDANNKPLESIKIFNAKII